MAKTLSSISHRFEKLYQKKVYLHHYKQYMESFEFEAAFESIKSLICKYNEANKQASGRGPQDQLESVVRYKPVGLSLAP